MILNDKGGVICMCEDYRQTCCSFCHPRGECSAHGTKSYRPGGSPVVYTPPKRHRCQIVPDTRTATFEVDGKTMHLPVPVVDPVGTVRACLCGRTWVAHRPPPMAGYAPARVVWRTEGRLARWWRERQARRAAGIEDAEESARWEAAKERSE